MRVLQKPVRRAAGPRGALGPAGFQEFGSRFWSLAYTPNEMVRPAILVDVSARGSIKPGMLWWMPREHLFERCGSVLASEREGERERERESEGGIEGKRERESERESTSERESV